MEHHWLSGSVHWLNVLPHDPSARPSARPFQLPLAASRNNLVCQDDAVVDIAAIGYLLVPAHLGEEQLLPRLLKARGIGILGNLGVGQEVAPLLQRHLRPAVEVVHLQDDVLREELVDGIHAKLLLLEGRQLQHTNA